MEFKNGHKLIIDRGRVVWHLHDFGEPGLQAAQILLLDLNALHDLLLAGQRLLILLCQPA